MTPKVERLLWAPSCRSTGIGQADDFLWSMPMRFGVLYIAIPQLIQAGIFCFRQAASAESIVARWLPNQSGKPLA